MHTSRFQLGLIATLSVGLGLALSSPNAIGYPAGSAVSYGSNPLWSAGGVIYADGSADVITAPSDQTLVVTDINLSVSSNDSRCSGVVAVALGDGSAEDIGSANKGRFSMGLSRDGYNYTQYHPIYSTRLESGAVVDPGDTLRIFTDQLWDGYCPDGIAMNYMISGYYAQP